MLLVYFHPSHDYPIVNILAEETTMCPQRMPWDKELAVILNAHPSVPTAASPFLNLPTAGEETVSISHGRKTFWVLFFLGKTWKTLEHIYRVTANQPQERHQE